MSVDFHTVMRYNRCVRIKLLKYGVDYGNR